MYWISYNILYTFVYMTYHIILHPICINHSDPEMLQTCHENTRNLWQLTLITSSSPNNTSAASASSSSCRLSLECRPQNARPHNIKADINVEFQHHAFSSMPVWRPTWSFWQGHVLRLQQTNSATSVPATWIQEAAHMYHSVIGPWARLRIWSFSIVSQRDQDAQHCLLQIIVESSSPSVW